MTDPQIIIDDLERGKSFLTSIIHDEIYCDQLGISKNKCSVDSKCLLFIIRSLDFRIEQELFDETTEKLYRDLVLIIGSYIPQINPTVDAGADQSVRVDLTAVFNAIATQGSAPIQSYLWTKLSGPTVLMTGTTTSQLTVSGTTGNMPIGVYIFQITVTDTNGNIGTDTVKLTTTALQVTIQYGYYNTIPVPDTITYQFSMQVNQGATEFTLPYTSAANNKFIAFSQPIIEPDKNFWSNTVLNYGTIPDSVFLPKTIFNNKDIVISRDIFIFDGSTYNIKFSV